MHSLRGLTFLCGLWLAAMPLACSDDTDSGKDSGAVDQGAVDQGAVELAVADQGGGSKDMSEAAQLKAETVAFVKLLTTSLPAAGSANKVETLMPKPGAIKGWVEDPSMGQGVQAGYTTKDIEALINGSHDPYAKEGNVGFAKEDYQRGKFKLVVFLWQMKTAAGAKKMFDKNKEDGEDNAGLTFETLSGVKDAAIIGDDKPQWKAFAHRGPYVFKIYTTYLP